MPARTSVAIGGRKQEEIGKVKRGKGGVYRQRKGLRLHLQ